MAAKNKRGQQGQKNVNGQQGAGNPNRGANLRPGFIDFKSHLLKPISTDDQDPKRVEVLTLKGTIADNLRSTLIKKQAKGVSDPIILRRVVIDQGFPGGRTIKHLNAVRSAIAAANGSGHLRLKPDFAKAILYEVYSDTGKDQSELDEADVREYASRIFGLRGPEIYQDMIRKALHSLGDKDGASDDEIEAIYQLLVERKTPIDAPDFVTQTANAVEKIRREQGFHHFFKNGRDLNKELKRDLTASQLRRAIQRLEAIGLDPASATDADWGRIALGLTSGNTERGDSLSLAGVGGFGGDGLDFTNFVPDFPSFDTDITRALNAESIYACADLYYIHQFGRMGIFAVIREVGRRFFADINLGQTQTAARIYRYIKLLPMRFPEEDWQNITNELFEEGPFKPLMGRMVEALIEYTRSRNAGDFFLAAGRDAAPSLAYARSSLVRSLQSLMRFVSDSPSGVTQFVRSEVGAQLMEIFSILNSEDLQRYYGGSFRSGMFAIIETEGRKLFNQTPPVDRNTTLAVFGRRVLRWLGDNAVNSAVLTDADLDTLVEDVNQWLAAYRRNTDEPEWIDEDDEYYENDEMDEMVEETIRSEIGEEDMDMLNEPSRQGV